MAGIPEATGEHQAAVARGGAKELAVGLNNPSPWRPASRRRRIASLAYESFLLIAVLFVAGFILVPAAQLLPPDSRRHTLQVLLAAVAGVYCVLCWVKGHTLAMKAWGITVRSADGHLLTKSQALTRFFWALPSLGGAGLGLLWCLFDRDKQFLHDRLAGTRLYDAPRPAPHSAPLEAQDQPHPDGEKQ